MSVEAEADSSDHLVVSIVERPPFLPLPPPRHLRLVPPTPTERGQQAELPLLLWTAPAPLAPVAPLRTRIRIYADPATDRLHGSPRDADDEVDPLFGRRMNSRAELSDPRVWTARFAQAALEIIAGRRTPSQLMRWTNRAVYSQLVYRQGAIRGRVQLHRIRMCEPIDGIAEAAVVARFNERAHALALRFEGLDGRWLCTALVADISSK